MRERKRKQKTYLVKNPRHVLFGLFKRSNFVQDILKKFETRKARWDEVDKLAVSEIAHGETAAEFATKRGARRVGLKTPRVGDK